MVAHRVHRSGHLEFWALTPSAWAKRRRQPRLRLEMLEERLALSLSTIAVFQGSASNAPNGGLTVDASGNVYGTTSQGGANGDGSVFEIVKGSGVMTTLASFDGGDGS